MRGNGSCSGVVLGASPTVGSPPGPSLSSADSSSSCDEASCINPPLLDVIIELNSELASKLKMRKSPAAATNRKRFSLIKEDISHILSNNPLYRCSCDFLFKVTCKLVDSLLVIMPIIPYKS